MSNAQGSTRGSEPGPISQFLKHHFRHFNAGRARRRRRRADAASRQGGKMMVTLAGAMSTAELGSRWPR
jgi:deoxyhypusine synthase